MSGYVLQPLRSHLFYNGFFIFLYIWGCQIRVKAPDNEEPHALGSLDDALHNSLQSGGVVQRKIAADNVTAAPFRHQMKSENISVRAAKLSSSQSAAIICKIVWCPRVSGSERPFPYRKTPQ